MYVGMQTQIPSQIPAVHCKYHEQARSDQAGRNIEKKKRTHRPVLDAALVFKMG